MTPKQRWESAIAMLATMYGHAVHESAFLRRQREGWNRIAPRAAQWDKCLTAWLQPVRSAMLSAAALRNSDRVLDAGCGTGELGLAAAGEVEQVVAVDFSEEMVRHAKKNASSRKIKNYTPMTAALSEMSFEKHRFDAVLARHVIGLLPSLKTGVKKLAHVLAPRRCLVISEWGPLERNPWAAVAVDAIRQVGEYRLFGENEPGPFRCSDPKTLGTLFKEADIHKEYAISEVTGEVRFNSAEHYWRFLSEVFEPVASALAGKLGERREAIRAAVVAAAKAHVHGDRPVFGWSAWVASGTKLRRRAQRPIRLQVQYVDQDGNVWHEHESIYPEPKDAKPPFKSFAEILPAGRRLGVD